MNKTIRFFFASLLVMFCGTVFADTKKDVLTSASFDATGNSYTVTAGVTATSDAEYYAQSATSYGSIQLRSNNNNSGIVTTKSGGKVKSVTIEFNSNTAAARVAEVYGKNEAYSTPTDLYSADTQGTLLGEVSASDPQTITVEGDFSFMGIRSKSGAMYIEKITIVWEEVEEDVDATPNLSVRISECPESVDADSNFSVTATITNEGATDLATFNVYAAVNGTKWTNSKAVTNLAAGASTDVNITVEEIYVDGDAFELQVVAVVKDETSSSGSFEFKSDVAMIGYNSSEIEDEVDYEVSVAFAYGKMPGYALPATVTVGDEISLPYTIKATYSDGDATNAVVTLLANGSEVAKSDPITVEAGKTVNGSFTYVPTEAGEILFTLVLTFDEIDKDTYGTHTKDANAKVTVEAAAITEQTATFDFTTSSYGLTHNVQLDGEEITSEGVTITAKKADGTSGTRYNQNDPSLRIYQGNALYFSAPEGKAITSIVFNSSNNANLKSGDEGTYEAGTWTGNHTVAKIVSTGYAEISTIVVTLADANENTIVAEIPKEIVPVVTVTITEIPETIAAGGDLVVKATVKNEGEAAIERLNVCPFTTLYSSNFSKWSGVLVVVNNLAAGEEREVTLTMTEVGEIEEDDEEAAEDITFQVKVRAIVYGTDYYFDSDPKSVTIPAPAAEGADVAITAIDVPETTIGEDGIFTMTVTLTNLGPADAENVVLSLRDADDNVLTSTTVGTVAVGETKTVELTWANAKAGTVHVVAMADNDSDDSNNVSEDITLSDVPTGIAAIRIAAGNATVYNTNGQKVQILKKGNVYIVNGKKTVVK